MVSAQSLHSSRDPVGVEPSGIDLASGADPPPDEHHDAFDPDPPILPPSGPPPPTPRRSQSSTGHQGIRAPSPVMAFLVGDPPPPPPTPPPHRNRAKSSTRRQHIPLSPPGDASTTTGFSSLSSSIHRGPRETGEPQELSREPSANTTDYLDQKRREALGIYESDKLYLESQHLHPATQALESRNHPVVNTGIIDVETADVDPIVSLASPRSAVTEPHSNKYRAPRKNSLKASSQELVEILPSDMLDKASKLKNGAHDDGNPSKKRQGRMSTGSTRVSKALLERRGRGKSQERGGGVETQEREKKGFFRKIFRGGKKKSSEGPTNGKSVIPVEPTRSRTKVKDPMVAGSRVPDVSVLPPHKLSPSTLQVGINDFKSTMPKERDTLDTSPGHVTNEVDFGMELDTVTSGLTNDIDPDRRDIFFAHDEVSTLTAPSAHSYSRRSIDPIQGTATTISSGLSSEPLGHYWTGAGMKSRKAEVTPKVTSPTIDPFNEPFFREPDGESPITSSQAVKSILKLHVQVPQTQDPTGETPPSEHSTPHMNEPSPRGWGSPQTELKDPRGSTMSESASRRTVPGFGCVEAASKPQLPPSQSVPPQDFRREPSAFRDGSPYALDPPLRVHEEGGNAAKSIVALLSKVSPKASQCGRIAAEPPTPTMLTMKDEAQPPTPVSIQSGPVQKATQTRVAAQGLTKENQLSLDKGPTNTNAPTPTGPTLPSRSVYSVDDKLNKAIEQDSPDATGFLDDLFQEKNPSRKRPSIGRPIAISISESTARVSSDDAEGTLKSPSKSQVIEIHRTQRLSGSPRSKKGDMWTQPTTNTETGDVPPLPVPVRLPVSPKTEGVLPRRSVREEEEEKKEQDQDKTYPSVEDPSSKAMLATSTAALSTAACMNAKTVAYLHTLNGEPSPRHSWRRPDLSDDEYSPVKSGIQRQVASNIKAAMSKKRAITVSDSDEAAFDTFISSDPARAPQRENGCTSGQAEMCAPRQGNALHSKTKALAPTSYSFDMQKNAQSNSKLQWRTKYGALSPRSRKSARENFRRPLYYFRFNRDVRVSGAALVFGLDLIRRKRIEDILNGAAVPVYKDKSVRTKKAPPPAFQCLVEQDIKDPIQRAGFRLLSKAAIPIQSFARRYLAQREASIRVRANVVLQAYFRRWKCEAYRRAYNYSCIQIQAVFRRWLARGEVAYKHFHATQIQKIVRGYIAAAYVYDTIYWVSRLQAAMRGKLARVHFAMQKDLRQSNAGQLQAWYRGCCARQKASVRRKAICSVQTVYRAHRAILQYQLAIVDIIVAQSVVRRFLAQKEAEKRRLVKMNSAARKIQATWRGFQGYTDYIFALVDILVLQRSTRKWLAKRKVDFMRREHAAIQIQAQWRRQTALIGMLYDLVHIIIAQSVVRRFLARKALPQKRLEYSRRMKHQQRLDSAAAKIQTAWRGFWGYSHFIIMQYEIIRLQAIIRGRASRILFSLKLGCCIMIQSAVRRHLASNEVASKKLVMVSLGAAVEGLRMQSACRRVQFWWRVVMECSREKKAALIIERFFLMVKAEVDREILRQHERQSKEVQPQTKAKRSKSVAQPRAPTQRKRRSGHDADEKLLENVWQNTVDEDHAEILVSASRDVANKLGQHAVNGRSSSAPRLHQSPSHVSEPSQEPTPCVVKHHPSSPTMNLVMRHDCDQGTHREMGLRARKEEALKASRRIQKRSSKLPQDVTLAKNASELSAITSPTVFAGRKKNRSSKKLRKHAKTFEDDLSLEESLLGEEIVDSVPPPQQGSKKRHFFSDVQHSKERWRSSSNASEASCNTSDDVSDLKSHLYSRTATTITRATTNTETLDSASPCSEFNADIRERKFCGDKHNSAASKGRKLIESVRKSSKVSPRHGQIVITNVPIPILSQDSHDNVELEYGGDQFGMI